VLTGVPHSGQTPEVLPVRVVAAVLTVERGPAEGAEQGVEPDGDGPQQDERHQQNDGHDPRHVVGGHPPLSYRAAGRASRGKLPP
jgi:hypothetical protein